MLCGYCTRKLVCVNDEWLGFFNLCMHTWRTLILWNTHIVCFIYKLTIRATATWFTKSNTYLIWLRTCSRTGFTSLKYLTTDWTWCSCKHDRVNTYYNHIYEQLGATCIENTDFSLRKDYCILNLCISELIKEIPLVFISR